VGAAILFFYGAVNIVLSYEDKLSALGCHIAGTGASVWDKLPPIPSCKCLFLGPQRDQVYSLENETEESWDDDFSQASIQGFLRNGTSTKMSKSSACGCELVSL
jgi:hypothetical protein